MSCIGRETNEEEETLMKDGTKTTKRKSFKTTVSFAPPTGGDLVNWALPCWVKEAVDWLGLAEHHDQKPKTPETPT